jgi:hypothetical protein
MRPPSTPNAVAAPRTRTKPGARPETADLLLLGTLALFAALAVGFRIERWALAAASDLAVGAVLLVVAGAVRRMREGLGRALARTAVVSLGCAYLFGAVDRLQLILRGRWLDASVLAFEHEVFGVQPTIWLERFVRPWLTEWMMFAYVGYLALYPLVCAAVYLRRGGRALEECLLALALANVACDLGFIAFPVAGPTAFMGSSYTVPLHGYLFTAVGEFIRTHLHYPGGSLPSPHAAAATVLWVMAWRHRRGLFWALAPLVLTLYVATFYCRFHYLTDTAAGIATAALAIAAVRPLQRLRDSRTRPR